MYLAYVYKLIHKITKEYYYGYRYANIKLQLNSSDDLGKVYFTSSEYINESNFHEYTVEIIAEFFNPDYAYDHEQTLIRENWGDPLLLNRHHESNGSMRFKITEDGIAKLKQHNAGKKWYNNGKIESHAHECPEGFTLGRLINPFPNRAGQPGALKGYKWYTNGTEYTMAANCPIGWQPGREPASDEVNNRISSTMRNGSAAAKGKRWYTNGDESVLTFDCPNGWRLGHSHQQTWYNITNPDGAISKMNSQEIKLFCKSNKLRYGSLMATVKSNQAYYGYMATKVS